MEQQEQQTQVSECWTAAVAKMAIGEGQLLRKSTVYAAPTTVVN